jgi:tetratricopeptide (TPR) repeat protein
MRLSVCAIAGAGLLFSAGALAQTRDELWQLCGRLDPDIAIPACTLLIESGAGTPQERATAFIRRGLSYGVKGDSARAIAELTEAIRLDPGNPRPYAYRAGNYEDSEPERALADYSEAIRLRPDAQAFTERAEFYLYRPDLARALADIGAALAADPGYTRALEVRALVHEEQGHLDLAIADMTEAFRIEPDRWEHLRRRGNLHMAKRDYDRAIADFDAVIVNDPPGYGVLNRRADAYRAKGDLDRAIAGYSELIRINPASVWYLERGEIHAEKMEIDLAIADFSEAIRLTPDFGIAYLARAEAFVRKPDLGRAIARLRRDPAHRPGLRARLRRSWHRLSQLRRSGPRHRGFRSGDPASTRSCRGSERPQGCGSREGNSRTPALMYSERAR